MGWDKISLICGLKWFHRDLIPMQKRNEDCKAYKLALFGIRFFVDEYQQKNLKSLFPNKDIL